MATATDATGADAYAEVLAAAAGNTRFRYLSAGCDTNDAMISLDGGATDFAHIIAGEDALVFPLAHRPQQIAVQAKNETASSNYAALVLNAW